MLYFLLSVAFTVSLYLIMRAFPNYKVNAFQAVVFNYYACVATGLLLMPKPSDFLAVDWSSTPTLLTLALGIMFVVVFLLIGQTATKAGVTSASLSSNMSLIIPVLFGLFVFKNNNKEFDFLNYAGIVLALVALGLSVAPPAPEVAPQPPEVAPPAPEGGANKGYFTGLRNLKAPPPGAGGAVFLLFLCSGANNTLINFLSSKFYRPEQTPLFMIIACVGAIIIGTSMLIFRILSGKEKVELRNIIGGFVLGVPNFLSLFFLLKTLAYFGNSAAFVFPIYNVLTILVSSLTAFLLFKEKLQPLNKVGLALAVVAIVFISHQELFKEF